MIAGCGVTQTIDESLPDYRTQYKKNTTLPPLEIPPNLTSNTIEDELVVPDVQATTNRDNLSVANKYQINQSNTVLPQPEKVQLKREGNTRWLVVESEPEVVWTKVRAFWLENGLTLVKEDSRTGLLETEWLENRGDIPQEGIRKYLSKALDTIYSASTRDKFKVRLERGNVAGTTEIYLTHRGAQEVSQGDTFVWQFRPTDPELEAEMLYRLMLFIGVEKKPAETVVTAYKESQPTAALRAVLTKTEQGQVSLVVNEDFAKTWRRTGLALDRVGFTVEDSDRSRGVYIVRYIDPDLAGKESGFFSWLFNSKKDIPNQEYLINLTDEKSTTRLTVLDKQGQMDVSKTAERILTLLHEQLK